MKSPDLRWVFPLSPPILPLDLPQVERDAELITRLLHQRGINTTEKTAAFLDPRRYTPASPSSLPDLMLAADRLEQAIANQELIGVWGDFDVDGQTSTTILVQALKRLAANVTYHIPVRQRESHGVHLGSLKTFLDQGVQLILTCDTGITAHDAVEYARQRGVEMIITDHHTLPPQLPDAYAVINPHRLPEGHPLSGLCGAGTAYKLAEELLQRAGLPEEVEKLLDLAALGTVADVAVLVDDNRWIVQRGLEQLRKDQRPGLRAILESANINHENINEDHIGFGIGPRLNALGRLGDANPIVELFTTQDETLTRMIASQLEALNSRRQLLCDQVFKGALAQIENDPSLLQYGALVLSHPEWEAGVIGIVASRLTELYSRPTLLIYAPPNAPARGSARSIAGINIIEAIAAQHTLLIGFGGHPMAAGFSLASDKITDFRRALDRTLKQMAGKTAVEPTLVIDAELPLSQANLELVTALEKLSPFGAGNPTPIFVCRRLKAVNITPLGRAGEHLRLTVEDETGHAYPVIWWQGSKDLVPEGLFDLAYTLRASDYRGQRTAQIQWLHAHQAEEDKTLHDRAHKIEILDFRQSPDPHNDLNKLVHDDTDKPLLIWSEGQAACPQPVLDRTQLSAAGTLVIWSMPPGPEELLATLQAVNPRRLVIFAQPSTTDQPAAFLKRLTGLARHTLKQYHGIVELHKLSAACAQRDTTILCGLDWIAARGFFQYTLSDNQIQLVEGDPTYPKEQASLEEDIRALLDETAHFRAFYRKTAPQWFVDLIQSSPMNAFAKQPSRNQFTNRRLLS